ncbi:hypothetical protein AVEN_259301-1 [Araneus ventricosus]|uniref:BTB domain-containing protein n=1 Tax=Araneus ventricosus TaxID=182803 RepID=A0A4Y2GML0_ARAVE|nr:hypothetical protein AVEN_259301-1 [Araneus ventricosus]
MEASFYNGMWWKATLQPLDHRRINRREFSCSLKLAEDVEIVALGVKIRILFNDFTIADKEESNYSFCARNRRTYYLTARAATCPTLVAHRLVVLIEISFRNFGNFLSNYFENIFNEKRFFFYSDEDLRWLSRDLRRLFTDSPFADMTLWSSDRQRSFRVHSYMIEARWDSFFREHPSDANDRDDVETNISDGLLSDILKYMYSGTMDTAGPERATPSYTAELFQVIDRYRLHHLYKVFAKSDSDQSRETRNDPSFHSKTFELDGSDNFHSWRIDARPKYEFVLRLKICVDEDDPWILYFLDSKSPIRVSAQVNLELLTIVRQRNRPVSRPRSRPLHERVCDVGSGGSVSSEIIRFRMDHRVLRGTEIRYSIRCTLSFSDGTTALRVGHASDNTLQDDRERFGVLKDHMSALLAKVALGDWSKCDFELLCHVEGETDAIILPLHKGIVSV